MGRLKTSSWRHSEGYEEIQKTSQWQQPSQFKEDFESKNIEAITQDASQSIAVKVRICKEIELKHKSSGTLGKINLYQSYEKANV